jgi:hypothetical protein
MGTLVALGEQAALKANLFQQSFIEEFAELSHSPPVQPAIVFIFGLIDHIEIST